jgi:putative membrane protein
MRYQPPDLGKPRGERMRKSIAAALGALIVSSLAAPLSPAFAQAGISTNPPSVETRDYLAAVHALSRYEIAANRLALDQQAGGALRSYAQTVLDHHTRLLDEQVRLLNIPAIADAGSALVGPLSEMLDSLQNVSRADFAVAYKRGQIAALEEAVKIHDAYAARGRDAGLRAGAQRAVAIARKHLDAARQLPAA